VIDETNREALAIRMDNGTELTSHAFTEWCERHQIAMHFIQPGKPDQNAFIERFNKSYREEVLDAYLFDSLDQVRRITESWIDEYNRERPHESLGRVPPLTVMPRQNKAGESALPLCA
jgi:putative transposase